MPVLPGIGEAFVRDHLQHLAVNDAVPRTRRGCLEGETLAFDGLEPCRRLFFCPAADELAVVSAFQIVSGACGKTSSTTMSCVSAFREVSFMNRSRQSHVSVDVAASFCLASALLDATWRLLLMR